MGKTQASVEHKNVVDISHLEGNIRGERIPLIKKNNDLEDIDSVSITHIVRNAIKDEMP